MSRLGLLNDADDDLDLVLDHDAPDPALALRDLLEGLDALRLAVDDLGLDDDTLTFARDAALAAPDFLGVGRALRGAVGDLLAGHRPFAAPDFLGALRTLRVAEHGVGHGVRDGVGHRPRTEDHVVRRARVLAVPRGALGLRLRLDALAVEHDLRVELVGIVGVVPPHDNLDGLLAGRVARERARLDRLHERAGVLVVLDDLGGDLVHVVGSALGRHLHALGVPGESRYRGDAGHGGAENQHQDEESLGHFTPLSRSRFSM